MSTDSDLRDALDRSFGNGPALPPVADQVILGRRRLRRRRAVAGVLAATAAVAVVGGAWTVTQVGDDSDRGVRVAQGADGSDTSDAEPWSRDEFVRFGPDGEVEVNPDAEVVASLEIEAAGQVGEVYRIRIEDETYDVLAVPETGTVSSVLAGSQGLNLGSWAMFQLDPDYLPSDTSWVRFDARDELVAKPGVTLVHQLLDPPFETFAGPQDRTAAAEVTRDGRTFFLAVRSLDGGPAEAIAYRQDRRVRTLEEFVDHARQQYAVNDEGGSEGLR